MLLKKNNLRMSVCIACLVIMLPKSGFSQTTFDFLPQKCNDQLIKYKGFTVCFSEKNKQANWVAYSYHINQLMCDLSPRTNDFRPDKNVKGCPLSSDYVNSGYDRGHLCPSEDMEYDPITMSESFFMTNISPQNPQFNRGIWKALENHVRQWTFDNEQIYIVAGSIVLPNTKETIGKNKIPVPTYFYKIVLDYQIPEYKLIAFLFENKKADRPLIDFRVSVDSLEKLTGFDFFPALPDELEDKLEDDNWKREPIFSKLLSKEEEKNKTSLTNGKENTNTQNCKAITQAGNRCKRRANENGFCFQHQP